MKRLLLVALLALLPAVVLAQGHGHGHSPYAGEEGRAIKSLSADDIAELRRGGGWGLARAAELNGIPGPAHLLELKDEIPLEPDQVTALETHFQTMQTEAIAQGERLIALEVELEAAFRTGSVNEDDLRTMLSAIAVSRSRLRFIHLRTHLATRDLLRPEQIERYNELRGYAAEPCAAVPPSHDPAMWRRHLGCD